MTPAAEIRGMIPSAGAIDCDVHVNLASTSQLLPYLDEFWREQVTMRGIDGMDLMSLPAGILPNGRPDWVPTDRAPGTDIELLRSALDSFGQRAAICHCIHGAQASYSEDLAAALCSGINDWLLHEWLERDERLRASIVIPTQNIDYALREIDRRSNDPRFVGVLLLVGAEHPLGKRSFWPIYQRAASLGLPIIIHAGSQFRHAPSATGWPSYRLEDYVNYCSMFQTQVQSLIFEGVFAKFPDLRVVLLESGFSWIPAFMWRMVKTWRALRVEVPWVKRSPADIMRDHIRVSMQPCDAPASGVDLDRVINQIGSDRMLLFSTDYPHWHFEGRDALPEGLPASLIERICVKNPEDTFRFLKEKAA